MEQRPHFLVLKFHCLIAELAQLGGSEVSMRSSCQAATRLPLQVRIFYYLINA